MKCYYHPEINAVALCKSCNRALCHECSVDVHPGTACINRCEEDVRSVNLVIQRSKTAYQKTGGAYKRNALFLLAIGFIFMLVGILPVLMGKGYATIFLAVMGVVFIAGAINNFRSSREISSVEE